MSSSFPILITRFISDSEACNKDNTYLFFNDELIFVILGYWPLLPEKAAVQ